MKVLQTESTMLWTIISILSLLLTAAVPSFGYQPFQDSIPNGAKVPHPCKEGTMWPGVGHFKVRGGGQNNPFGEDFKAEMYSWTENLCRMDSDNDGYTNGEELGDPNCVWTQGEEPSRTDDITHPGVCQPIGSPRCADQNGDIECDGSAASKHCEYLQDAGVMTTDMLFERTMVPATETNYYCKTFDLPADQDYHIMAVEAVVDNWDVVHHMLIYGCHSDSARSYDTPSECDMSGQLESECNILLGMWALGIDKMCYGENMGFRVGESGYKRVKIEIHWNNPMEKAGMYDASGLRLYYQIAREEVQNLTTMMVGQEIIEIPPGDPHVEVSGLCSRMCTYGMFKGPMYVTMAINHMHYLGRSMYVDVYRDGKHHAQLTNDQIYDYDSPVPYVHSPHVEVLPGDEIKTTCVYDSTKTDRYTYYGDATSDEMCFAFLIIYPSSQFLMLPAFCGAKGPLDVCEIYLGIPKDDCDWAKFINFTKPETAKTLQNLRANCNVDGFCRPECRRVAERLHSHPCLLGEMGTFSKNRMSRSAEGIEFMARLNSCPVVDCEEQCPHICRDDPPRGPVGAAVGHFVNLVGLVTAAASVWMLRV